MSGSQVPDGGHAHPDAASGAAFNGDVGLGVAEVLLGIIGQQPGVRTICDLGCGNGYLAGQLGQRGFTVLGIDASASYLEMARQRHASEQVTFRSGLIEAALVAQLKATTEPFDMIVSSDVIEHLYHPLEFLETAFALLRPGGTAIIGTPYHGYLKNVAISLTGKWDLHHSVHWHGGHIKFFSVPSLKNLMLQAGFTEPRFEYYGRMPGLWKNMFAISTRPA